MAGPDTPHPAAPADFEALAARLSDGGPHLPRRLRQVARFVLNRPEDVALNGIVQLAALADVPPSTLTRFAKELGFAGFNEMQAVFRERLVGPAGGFDAAAGAGGLDLDDPTSVFATFIQSGTEALARLHREVDPARIVRFVDLLTRARSVYIVSARGAFGVGTYCYYGLSQVGKDARLVDNLGTMRAEQIRFAGPEDVILAMTFDDYTPETVALAEDAARRGLRLLCLTDNPMSPIARLGEEVIFLREARLGHFRSQVPALVLCQSIIVSVGRRLGRTED